MKINVFRKKWVKRLETYEIEVFHSPLRSFRLLRLNLPMNLNPSNPALTNLALSNSDAIIKIIF